MDKASVISSDAHHAWAEFVSDKLKNKLFELKSDNGIVPLGTVDEIVQLFVNDIEKLGNTLKKERERRNLMKLSKIIDELTGLKEYIGDKDLKECTVSDWTRTSLEGEKMESQLNTAMSDQNDAVEVNYNGDGNVMPVGENMQTHDMNANKLQTEEEKIQWLENEISELEYALSSDCIYRTNLLCRLQMYREYLGMLENSQNKMIWHPYNDCGDAPKVAEYQNDVFLCKVQMYHSDNDEPVGTPVYKVLLCDDDGVFYGYRKNDGDCYNKVIAWTEIIE